MESVSLLFTGLRKCYLDLNDLLHDYHPSQSCFHLQKALHVSFLESFVQNIPFKVEQFFTELR